MIKVEQKVIKYFRISDNIFQDFLNNEDYSPFDRDSFRDYLFDNNILLDYMEDDEEVEDIIIHKSEFDRIERNFSQNDTYNK